MMVEKSIKTINQDFSKKIAAEISSYLDVVVDVFEFH